MSVELDPNTQAALDLESSTLEEIVDALSTGRVIVLPGDAGTFRFQGEDARIAFRYYASHRDLWPQQKQLSSREVEDLLKAFSVPVQVSREPRAVSAQLKRGRWRIVRLEAHRFAGLHRHCDEKGDAPESLTLDFERDVTCIWGFNGAGKTALQSAILWCLTGKALRSQHKPADVHEPISVEVLAEQGADDLPGEPARSILLPPIVPLPSASELSALGEKPACDTWVELRLKDQDGKEVVVKREVKRGSKGGITAHCHGLEQLGLPQWAVEAGTLMPAIASTMRFDERTTFADAIAQLTGLRPLQELGRRSERIVRRLEDEEVDKAKREGTAAAARFERSKRTFLEAWSSEATTLGETPQLFRPEQETTKESCKSAIEATAFLLAQLQAQGQSDVDAILRHSASLESKEGVKALADALAKAKECFTSAFIGSRSSIDTVKRLNEISDDDRAVVVAKLRDLAARAEEQVKRQQRKQDAARWQLYTMVSQWHRTHHPEEPLVDCPVCGTDLTQVPPDALLDRNVADALRASAQAHTDAAKTLLDWLKDAGAELLESLPESVRPFVDKKLQSSLLSFYRTAYVTELLNDSVFAKELRALKENAVQVWDIATQEHPLPEAPETESVVLPDSLRSSPLATRFANLQVVMELAHHRQLSEEQLKLVAQRYFGSWHVDRSASTSESSDMSKAPLRSQFTALQNVVTSVEPLVSLVRQLREIEAERRNCVEAHKREYLLARVAVAVREFGELPKLVHRQVEGLIQVLDERTREWLGVIYRPHYVGGPSYLGLDPTRVQGVGLYAGIGSLRVHANEVMNSSQLRACVWAFVFSLWERIRDRMGAIEVLQLDDPQTYFDPVNTENLAAAIPKIVEAGMAPIITSNDNRFVAAVKSKLPRDSSGSPSWTMLSISPISKSRLTAALTPAFEEVIERRDAWEADESDVAKAQQFVERVRLHIENRLWDLLAADPILMHKPTLADLISHIANARNGGEQPFNEVPFERLLSCPALRHDAPFYLIINRAHHALRDVTPYDAAEVAKEFDDIERILRSCSACYARFMGRLTREDEDLFFSDSPAAPPAISLDREPIRVLGEFSARTYADALAVDAEYGTFSFESLGEVALYAIRGASLGALALPGQVVVASLAGQAKSGDPVIALFGGNVLARRCHTEKGDPSRIMLACDQSATERVAPALTAYRSKVRILPIVGVLYDDVPRAGNGEAYLVDNCSVLSKRLVAARIIEDSGYPVIRSGDLALLEEIGKPENAALDGMKGDMVAFVASRHGEQFAYLKRVGAVIHDGLRIFENVGTFGDALAVDCAASSVDSAERLTLQCMWRVHGVIRVRP